MDDSITPDIPSYPPPEWDYYYLPDELCLDEYLDVLCQLVDGHGGRHYNRDRRLYWSRKDD